MPLTQIPRSCVGAVGFPLIAGGIALPPGTARAQLNPQGLLKQVLPGATGDGAVAGERACQRQALLAERWCTG